MRKYYFLFIFLYIILGISEYSEEIVVTSSGRKIILYDDHTWKEYSEQDSIDYKSLRTQLRKNISASEDEIKIWRIWDSCVIL